MHIISFLLCLFLVLFSISLKRRAVRYQFYCLGYSTICAICVIFATNCLAYLTFLGKIWVIFVPMMVAVNDISAYICGMSMGRRSLISLSPNKTMEGFVGGAILTLVFTYAGVDMLFSNF